MDDALRQQVKDAVALFWQTRTTQGRKVGKGDRGGRTAVTGGRQLDGFVELVRDLLERGGLDTDHIHVERRKTILPGFFRPTKEWDIVAVVNDRLMATIEFKSQVGPSFGNNFNNRTEEAIGSAHDFWTAYREGAFYDADAPRPWLGYLMLLEDAPGSRRPVKVDEPHFPVFPEFQGASYGKRYELLCKRLVRERLYDAACLLTSTASEGVKGDYKVPSTELGIEHFAASLTAHASSFAN